jgi:hypothetical protein
LVIIEHFFKLLELVPLPNHNSEGVTHAFLDKVLSRFNALVKVLTNYGTKFHGDFQKLCEKALINHQITSQNHLEANGLTKQMMQMVKQGLHRYGLQKGRNKD